jgi:hypothetical protein
MVAGRRRFVSALNVEIAARVVIYLLYTCGWLLTSIFFIRRLLLCSLYYSRFARLNSVLTYSPKTHGGKKETRKKKLTLNTMKIGDRFHPFIRQILLIFFFWFYVRRSTMRVTMSWHFFFNGERRRRYEIWSSSHWVSFISPKSHGGTKLPMRPHVVAEKKNDQMRKRNLFIFFFFIVKSGTVVGGWWMSFIDGI